jgi:SAM-dependent methyltransferase
MKENAFNPNAYWEDRLHTISGLEGVGFKKLGPAFNKWAYKVRKKVFMKALQGMRLNFKSLNAIDIGSGTGFYIQAWRELMVKDITGADISRTAVENLRQTFKQHTFHQIDIGDKDYNAQAQLPQVDLVSSMDVLFHIVDDVRFEQAIANISGLLKEGGYFIYSDNFLHGNVSRGESQVSRTKAYLVEVFEKNKLQLVQRQPFMYLTNSPIDSKNPLLKAYWFLLENTLYMMPFLGNLIGAALYPFELFLVNRLRESPTTEFAIFQKVK